jgi:HPt (histidine-containing phosphotransfer) domain-containing protein
MTSRHSQDARIDLDPQAIARAEAALAEISAGFPALAAGVLDGMEAAWAACQGRGAAEAGRRLHRGAHNLKGEGGSFGYPLVSVVAASLCLLLEHGYARIPEGRPAIEAHLAALRAVLAARLTGDGGTAGRDLLAALRDAVARCARAAPREPAPPGAG